MRELILIPVFVVALAWLGASGYRAVTTDRPEEATRQTLRDLAAAARAYQNAQGKLPQTDSVEAFNKAIGTKLARDGWGHIILYRDNHELVSFGPDGKYRTGDDLCVDLHSQ